MINIRFRRFFIMSDYEFITIWNIDAPLERVWSAIEDADAWPGWWKGVVNVVELQAGDKDGVGSIRRTVWKSALPYKLEFDSEVLRVERLKLIEARAFGVTRLTRVMAFDASNCHSPAFE